MTVSSPLDSVRAQYEALPYPSRDPRDEAIRLITGTPSHVLEINHYLYAGRLNFIRPFRALVAGGIRVLEVTLRTAAALESVRAIRAAVPGANIGLAMLAALGITFPVNVLIGLPLYQHWVSWFY